MKKHPRIAAGLAALLLIAGCYGRTTEKPAQIIYRFDDHRYLEIVGFYCQGALNYVDTKRGMKSEIASQFYRAFSEKYIHPSERYIVIPDWDGGAFIVSKDYGQTWQTAPISGDYAPSSKEAKSLTVVNDRGYFLTKDGRLYVSSAPFDDPRILPGGPGIDYFVEGERGTITPQSSGRAWGREFLSKDGLKGSTMELHSNWDDFPQKVPDVINYQGWDHMKCNPALGLEEK
ncbi:hypothetical protein EDF78_1117 [Rahnella sp. BIGb0236]|uniref:T6SS immunity protein Tli3 family protein n=1 Tax=Rahnella sp. BIGb0236 TaxID=2485117 RepID=UPI00105DDD72|nr:hypothetical protein [Rahnella sp. BIGb0236]TDS88207.1 hypothetical protein EDF78_1117 [Rahnella sp. BIGb0236]